MGINLLALVDVLTVNVLGPKVILLALDPL
jgi:hypothetical protein